ncbi:MAG: hypothetical protein ACRED1_04190 [Limisphaerales bacterium]
MDAASAESARRNPGFEPLGPAQSEYAAAKRKFKAAHNHNAAQWQYAHARAAAQSAIAASQQFGGSGSRMIARAAPESQRFRL